MIRSIRIRLLEDKIGEDEDRLSHMVGLTEELHNRVFSDVIRIKQEKDINWEQAIEITAIQEEFFQLLLHKQWIGYLAESVRQKSFQLFKLRGRSVEFKDYKQVIEKGTSKREMEKLLRLFMADSRPLLEEIERS